VTRNDEADCSRQQAQHRFSGYEFLANAKIKTTRCRQWLCTAYPYHPESVLEGVLESRKTYKSVLLVSIYPVANVLFRVFSPCATATESSYDAPDAPQILQIEE